MVNLVHNDVSSETECRYTCKENYEWKNSACVAKKQTVACTGLPANAVWNSSTVVQEWNGTAWTPETTGIHTTGSATDKCYFKCIDEGTKFDWDTTTSTCKGHKNSNVACDNNSLPANASWWNANINQTWSGTEWLPTTTGSFSNSAIDNQCRFKCNDHYNWNGATCEAETKISACETLPANAQWNTASSITQHWDESASGFVPTLTPEYGTEATTAYCRYKCKENYERKNGSCQPATKTSACTGLPANAVWNTKLENGTLSNGQITQTWDGSEWQPDLSGGFGGQDAPAANSCIFKCEDNYEWKDSLCTARKQTVPCIVFPSEIPEGLPEDADCDDIESCCRKYPSLCQPANAAWNEVPTVLQEWKGAAWSPSDVGIYSDEPSQSECFFKCKENYSWDEENEVCVPDTRIADCTDLPNGAVWNYAPEITQTWSGKEWLPPLEAKYSASASEDECLYICDTGMHSYNNQCTEDVCATYTPCSGVNNSTATCTNNDNMLLPYTCTCRSGYYWYGKTGCKSVKPQNVCTGAEKCYNSETEIACPQEGKAFYGQDAQYAEAGFCAPQNFVVQGTEAEPVIYDRNTGLKWQKKYGDYMDWSEAEDYCESLNYGGITSGWRVPNVKEIQTILDYGKIYDNPYFTYTERLWTSNEDIQDSTKAWYTYFYFGRVDTVATSSYKCAVRCVYGTELNEGISTSTTNGVTKDTNTKLYWANTYASYLTWEKAFEYCDNLEYGGYSDWRVPNINELSSLINHAKYNPASDFAGMPSETFWSSTTSVSANTEALIVYFRYGSVYGSNKIYNLNVRCVRSDLCDSVSQFWDGKNCVSNPCYSSNPCSSVSDSDGQCTPLTSSTYSCGCNEGYRWDEDSASCVADPCFDNKCESMEGSDGVCTPVDGTNFTCGCTNGYFWDGLRCRSKKVFGNICTGQTTCYNASASMTCPASPSADFYGQDAQYAAQGTCAPKQFTVSTISGNNVVRDWNTGLMWQQTLPSSGSTYTKYTFNQAVTYCANLTYAGYSDWRLPKPKELMTIMDSNRNAPAMNTTYFPKPDSITSYGAYFWASKKSVSNTNTAWYVYLNYGSIGRAETTESQYVRCVRGEPMAESSSFTEVSVNGDVVVKDNLTGLEWQQTYVRNKTWQQALDYCETLDYAGHTDWRMPNKDELLSLTNYDRSSPASDFPGMTSYYFWSSSTTMLDSSVEQAWYLGTSQGSINWTSKTTSRSDFVARCVR